MTRQVRQSARRWHPEHVPGPAVRVEADARPGPRHGSAGPLVGAEQRQDDQRHSVRQAPSVDLKPPWQTITSARSATSSWGTQGLDVDVVRHVAELVDAALGVAHGDEQPDGRQARASTAARQSSG